MIVKRERYYTKYWKCGSKILDYKIQERKMTSYWLFGIIPIFINIEILSGDFK